MKVTHRSSRHPGASKVTCQCCQVLDLNSRKGYSYPGTFRQRSSGNNLSIPLVPCLKDEANEEAVALVELSLNFCHAFLRQERSNHRKKTASAYMKNNIATKMLILQSSLIKYHHCLSCGRQEQVHGASPLSSECLRLAINQADFLQGGGQWSWGAITM